MRWNVKRKPKPDSWRIIKKFAFFPVLVDLPTKQYVWLEFYKVNQRYRFITDGYSNYYEWKDEVKAVKEYWSEDYQK